jgi:amino acid transporter
VIISVIVLAISWFVVDRGLRLYIRVQWFVFASMAVAGILVWVLLAFTTQSDFINRFNSFMLQYSKTPDYYHYVIKQAALAGYAESSGIDWGATLGLSALVWISLGWAWFVATMGSEIRHASDIRVSTIMMLAPLWIGGIWLAGAGFLMERTMGATFFHSIGYLAFNASPALSDMPTTPYFYFLIGLAASQYPITLLLFLGVAVSCIAAILFSAMAATRVTLAATFDRLFPEALAKVSGGTHSPFVSVGAVFLLSFFWVLVYNFTTFTSYIGSAFLISLVAFSLSNLSGVLAPIRLKELYSASPLSKWTVLGIPAISVVGAIGLAFNLYLIYLFLTVAGLFANTGAGLLVVGGSYLLVVVWYLARWLYLRGRGVRLALAFAEIPPE